MKKYRMIKGKMIHVNQLAAQSRKFTVKNNVIGSKTKEITLGEDYNPIKVTVQNGKMYYQAPFHQKYQVYGSKGGQLFEITEKPDDYGLHFHLVEREPWKHERHKQPKRLIKCKTRKHTNYEWTTNGVGGAMRAYSIKHSKRNDFTKFFPNYPYVIPKMKKEEYWEKLVQHKLAKWERKNPRPVKKGDNDMFEEEFMTPWNLARNRAEERIRDFVVSVYDKLLLTGRFKMNSSGSATYQEKKIAELKDIDGEGHRVNELGKDSKLLKKAQKITNEVHAKHANLMCANLRDHKRKKGRIVLPQAA